MSLVFFLGITLVGFAIPLVALRLGKEWLIALLPIFLITGNVFAESFVYIFGVLTSLAIPIYSATFLTTDLLLEHYGMNDAKRAVFVGFLGQVFFVSVLLVIKSSPIMPQILENYTKTFAYLPRLIMGSFTAYIVSQFWDIYIYQKIKVKTGKRLLWLRNNLSTASSQLIDTTIFLGIAFYGRPPFETLHPLIIFILSTWGVKVVVAGIDTLYIYLSVWWMGGKAR